MTDLGGLDPKTSAYRVLCHLTFRGGVMKPAEIAKVLGENGSTVRARLSELRKLGLVDQKPDGYASKVQPYDIVMKIYADLGKE